MSEARLAQASAGGAEGAAAVTGRIANRRYSPVTARVISDLIGFFDGVVAAATGIVTGMFYSAFVHMLSGGFPRLASLSLLGAVIFAALGYGSSAYDLNKLRRFTHEGFMLFVRWTIAILLLISFAFLLKVSDATSRGWLLLWYASGTVTLLVVRIAWRQIVRSAFQRSPALRRRVAVIGSNQAAHRICAQMRRSHAGVDVIGIFDNSIGDEHLTGIGPAGVVGTIDELITLCRVEPIDDVLITLPWSDEDKINALVRQLRVLPCGVHLVPAFLESGLRQARWVLWAIPMRSKLVGAPWKVGRRSGKSYRIGHLPVLDWCFSRRCFL